jgi:hypothetical protein
MVGGSADASGNADVGGTADLAGTADASGASDAGRASDAEASGPSGIETPTHTTVSWWDATSGPESRTTPDRPGEDPRPTPDAAPDPTSPAPETPPVSADAATAIGWAWLGDDHPGLVARIGRALLGWVPIALGLGWMVGEVSGCGRFSAACDPAVTGSTWVIQLAVLGVLLLVPRLAAVAAVGAVAALMAAVPLAVLVTASGGIEDAGAGGPGGSTLLGGLVAIAWVAGLVVGAVRVSRRGARPLS